MQNFLRIPVDLLIELHRSADAVGKEKIETWIRGYKAVVERKGHVAEGFRKTSTGELVFDEALYDEAVYRGKVETYSRVTKERIERLRGDFEMLQQMGEAQRKAMAAVPDGALVERVGQGEPIAVEDLRLLAKLEQLPMLQSDSKVAKE